MRSRSCRGRVTTAMLQTANNAVVPRPKCCSWIIICVVVGMSAPTVADDVAPPQAPASTSSDGIVKLSDVRDPFFEKYVDIPAIGGAWKKLDPAGLIDGALQLKEAERILKRSHRCLTSQQLALVAARLCGEKDDRTLLSRLDAFADDAAIQTALKESKEGKTVGRLSATLPNSEGGEASEVLMAILKAKITGDSRYIVNPDGARQSGGPSLFAHLDPAKQEQLEKIMGASRALIANTSAIDPRATEFLEVVSSDLEQFHVLPDNLERKLESQSRAGDAPIYDRSIGGGLRFDVDRSGAGVRVNDNLRIGVEQIRDFGGDRVEQRGSATIVDREPKSTGIGFDYRFGGSRGLESGSRAIRDVIDPLPNNQVEFDRSVDDFQRERENSANHFAGERGRSYQNDPIRSIINEGRPALESNYRFGGSRSLDSGKTSSNELESGSRVTRDDIDRQREQQAAQERRMEELQRASENAAISAAREAARVYQESIIRPTLNEGRPALEFNYRFGGSRGLDSGKTSANELESGSRVTRDDIDRQREQQAAQERRMEELQRASENAAISAAREAARVYQESIIRPTLNEGRPALEFNYRFGGSRGLDSGKTSANELESGSRVTRDDIDRQREQQAAQERRMEELQRASENAAISAAREAVRVYQESIIRPTLNEGRPALEFNYRFGGSRGLDSTNAPEAIADSASPEGEQLLAGSRIAPEQILEGAISGSVEYALIDALKDKRSDFSDGWGHQASIWTGDTKVVWQGIRSRVEKIYHDKNDGTWQRGWVRPENTRDTLDVKIRNTRKTPGKAEITFQIYATCQFRGFVEARQYKHGVQLWGIDAEGRARGHIYLNMRVWVENNRIFWTTDSADMKYSDVVLDRTGSLGGYGARALGDFFTGVVDKWFPAKKEQALNDTKTAVSKAFSDNRQIPQVLSQVIQILSR